jgi:hypothetical protein
MLGLPFDPENGGDTFFRKVGLPPPDYMALYSEKRELFNTETYSANPGRLLICLFYY